MPAYFVVSMGDYNGTYGQYAVKGNSPWPGRVGVSTGLVKYELIGISYVKPDGSFWDRKGAAANLRIEPSIYVQGTVLVQLIEGRKLKFEAFPGKTASQVRGFTEAAKHFER